MYHVVKKHGRSYQVILAAIFIICAIFISAGATRGHEANYSWQSFSYISPVPNAEMVSTSTTIAVRSPQVTGAALFDALSFTVSGTRSGRHVGEKVLAGDGRTVLFKPAIPFEAGEEVTVSLDSGQESVSYSFHVAMSVPTDVSSAYAHQYENLQDREEYSPVNHGVDVIESFRTAPKDLPRYEVTKGIGTPGEGYVFFSPFNFVAVGSTTAYLLILDNNAEPVYYYRFPNLPNAMDFKLNPNGQLTYHHRAIAKFQALNNRYEEVATYGVGNGYRTDLHDIQFLDNGHRLHLIYDRQIMDMSVIVPGGHPEAEVTACIVQEIDTEENVVFEWRGWDHIPITDTAVDVTRQIVNYMNCNSIEQDYDGNLLLSSRNLDEVTKINRQTGDIIWRMGGKKNEFDFTNDDGFSAQHDARRLANGHITMYDNVGTNIPPRSRGIELEVDETNKSVTVVGEFRGTPDNFSPALGNMQRLPGGNTVIGWGRSSEPLYTEFDGLGGIVLEFNSVTSNTGSYRAFRFPWKGDPQWPPALIAYANGLDVELFFSWNGSTDTTGYMIYAAPEVGDPWLVDTVAKDGFENYYNFQLPSEGVWNFYVVALDQDSQPTEESNRVTLLIGGKPVYLPMISLAEEVQNN